MKKLPLLVCFSLLISSCSFASRARLKDKKKLEQIITQKVVEAAPNEDTHELVEASADDEEIKEKVGSRKIDDELESDDDEKISPDNFLKNKKTRRMQFWVDYFVKKDRARFQRFLNNGEEYREYIEEIFAKYGLPKELYFVGLIESGYYLGAKSRASAVGPWQFIRGTGKRYGLKISTELDERQDLFKATDAAARYFRDLNKMFSNWELALSSYNAGENGVLRRIRKYKTRDFYQLSKNKLLPPETINYVPKVLAAMHIVNNAKKYGFHLTEPKKIFDQTELRKVNKNLPLWKIAKEMKVSLPVLKKLNPELRLGKTPRYYSGTYRLRIPTGSAHMLWAPSLRESRKEVMRRTASVHQVRRGETLTTIARKYGTSPGVLARLNHLRSWRTNVRVGQRLQVEKGTVVVAARRAPSVKPIVYKVRRGDNISSLAELFRTKVAAIKRVNKLRNGQIVVGQKIVLPGTKKGVYTVRRGDHLVKIAEKFNQPIDAIIKLNRLPKRMIFPGQKLVVDID